MARVQLEIFLDDPDRSYAPRETIRGTVRADVETATRCDGLAVFFTERIRSEHVDREQEHDRREILFVGDWEPGTYEYPFEIPGPRWPPNHEGGLFTQRWMISAGADIPLAFDPKTHAPIDVEVPSEDGFVVVHKNPGDPQQVHGTQRAARIGLIFTAIFAAAAVTGHFVDDQLFWAGTSFGVIALLVTWYQWSKTKAIGAPQLVIEHDDGPPDALRCTLHVKPKTDIARVDCRLVVAEKQVVRTGGSKGGSKTYEHTVLEKNATLDPVDDTTYRGVIELPDRDELPFTRQSGGTSLGWTIVVVVHLKNGVDYATTPGVLWAVPARGAAADIG